MTEKEAIKRLKDHFRIHNDRRPIPYLDEAVSMAIDALEKQISKKPIVSQVCNWIYRCPCCNKTFYWTDKPKNHGQITKYCPDCRQHLEMIGE